MSLIAGVSPSSDTFSRIRELQERILYGKYYDSIKREEEEKKKKEEEGEEGEEGPICMKYYNNTTRQKYTITSCQREHPLCKECARTIARQANPKCPMCRVNFRGIENPVNKTFSFSDKKLKKYKSRSYKSRSRKSSRKSSKKSSRTKKSSKKNSRKKRQ